MSSAGEIVSMFHDLGIDLWVDADRLRYRFPSDVCEEKVDLLRRHKAEIVDLLKSDGAPSQFYQLSKNQTALSYIQSHNPTCAAYNAAFAVKITSDLDIRVWRNCLQKLSARHPLLRSSVQTRHDQFVGQIYPYREVSFEHIDASTWNDQDLRQRVQSMQKIPFDLETGSLWKNYLFSQSQRQHIALFVIHHTIIDGWSFWQLLDELFFLYESEVKPHTDIKLPPVTHQYAQFVNWQENWLESDEGLQAKKYWECLLENAPTITDFPEDMHRPSTQSYEGASHSFKVPGPLTEKLIRFSKENAVSLYSTLLSAFQILVYRYSRQEDILVGTPMSGRMNEDYDQVIGYFVNLLPTRANFEKEIGFRDFVLDMHRQIQSSMKHQSYPFPLLANQFDPKNDRKRHPLLQYVFGLQDAHLLKEAIHLYSPIATGKSLTMGSLTLEHFPVAQQEGQFDLNLDMMAADGVLYGSFKYRTDLFRPDTLSNLERHFIHLLKDIVECPEKEVSKLSLLSQSERAKILEMGGVKPSKSYPSAGCIVKRFETAVKNHPNAIAVRFENESLSYNELDAKSNKLCHYLIESGVKPNDRVGICLHRCNELIVTILAVLKAGAAYVPIDHRYPKDRREMIVTDSECRLIITQSDLLSDLPVIPDLKALCIDTQRESWSSLGSDRPDIVSDPTRAAYVIYTSGSTGKPKGTIISHHNVTRLFDATESQFKFNHEDVWTLFHSPAFDFSVWEIWGALLYGGRLVILPFEATRTPTWLLQILEIEGVTILNQTPSAFKQLIHAELSSYTSPHLPKLRCVIFGGEALDPPALSAWVDRYGLEQPQLVNMYGITETTVHVTYHLLNESDLKKSISPIGRAIEDLHIYIVDKNIEPVPVGVCGEICVGGAGVSSGYLNRPALNQEKFINDPFDPDSANKLYRSGDLGRFLPDGSIEYKGRMDHQVKIRGFRIELGEIQTQITKHPSISTAAVIIRDDAIGEKTIVAYCVKNQQEVVDGNDLRLSLLENLPEYMIPSAFVFLDHLPLTTNGKLAINQLPVPSRSPRQEAKRTLPTSSNQKIILEAWQEVLAMDDISTEDTFFELGGNSLLMNRVFLLLKKHFGSELTMMDLFQYPTIQTLAQHLESRAPQASISQQLNPKVTNQNPTQNSVSRTNQRNRRMELRKQNRK